MAVRNRKQDSVLYGFLEKILICGKNDYTKSSSGKSYSYTIG